jgi:methyl-accepting chemotaxis protein
MSMRDPTVYQRLALIIGILSLAMVLVTGAQILTLRTTVLDERQAKVHEMVGAATAILSAYDDQAKAGRIPADRARQLAFDAISTMRWGQYGDYFGIYGAGSHDAGVTYVHANPKYINVNRWDYKDGRGRRLIQDIVGAARSGGGFVEYYVPRAAGGEELKKLAYVGAYGTGEQLLAVQAGVYVDDVDAAVVRHETWPAAGCLAGLLLACVMAVAVGRGLTRPLAALCGTMTRLADGDLAVEVPFAQRRNEIGGIARSLGVFKDRLLDAERQRRMRAEERRQAEADKQAALGRTADIFEQRAASLVAMLSSDASQLDATARSMAAAANQTTDKASTVAAAAAAAGAAVHTAADAAEALAASVGDIGREVARSSTIAARAVQDAGRTDAVVRTLADGTRSIGHVVELIASIAGQTNLLALNATIEAARAGEAGRGFAVVAGEVKSLAVQTARATEDIGQRIRQIQGSTEEAVRAIGDVGTTIQEVSAIAATIAAAVERQGAATRQIASSVEQTASGNRDVAANIAEVSEAARDTGTAARQVLGAAGTVSQQAAQLTAEVSRFVASVRVA